MLAELSDYYRQQGISAKGFHCRHEATCTSVCKRPGSFVPAREAFVGSEYEIGGLPRLLFISLDPDDGGDAENRTLEYMRSSEESKCNTDELRKGTHWYETHELADRVMSAILKKYGKQKLDFHDVHKYFAHTNSAKCKDRDRGTEQGDLTLFRNCREFIPGEVAVLNPDIIITQGNLAEDAIKQIRNSVPLRVHPTYPKKHYKIYEIPVAQTHALAISTYHPRYGGYRTEKREAFSWYVECLAELAVSRAVSPQ